MQNITLFKSQVPILRRNKLFGSHVGDMWQVTIGQKEMRQRGAEIGEKEVCQMGTRVSG